MTTLYGSVRLRPTRIGFLVPPTNMDEVRRIIQICTCLWGGPFNPIIPVCDELPEQWTEPPFPSPKGAEVTRGYLDFFEPDVFVESEVGLATRAGVATLKLTYGEPRVAPLNAFFDPPETRRRQPQLPFGLAVLDVYKELYERQFQFVRRHDSRVVLFDGITQHDAFVEAAFGGFPTQGVLAPLAKAYREIFDPVKLDPSGESWVKVTKENCATPLRFTMHDVRRDPDGYSDPLFFVADPNSPLDLIDLWNLRQFAAHVLPINSAWATEARDTIREVVTANYRPLPGNPHGVMIHTTFQFGRSFSEDRAREVAFSLLEGLPPGSWSYTRRYDEIWSFDRLKDRVMRPRRARLSCAESDLELLVTNEQKERSVRFRSLAPGFASLYGGSIKARWANVITLHAYTTDESLALVLPSDTPQETVGRMRLGGDGAVVSREGLVLPQHFKNHGEFLHLVSGAQLFGEYFQARGLAAKPSDAGRITDQVLKSVGGTSRAALLAHRETLNALDDMAKTVRQFNDGKTEQYPDRARPVRFWRSLIAKRNSQKSWFGDFALEAFVKAGILRLGLSLQCPNCLNYNWCGLPEIDEQLLCEQCRKQFDFPQGGLNFDHSPWQYRVVGPFAVPDYAGGAYATVLALRVFSQNLGGDAQLTHSTGLEIVAGPDNKYEIDFAFWYRRRHTFDRDEEPVLVFGEAKSFAAESFKTRDIERMEVLAKTFPSAFLVFATMKDAFSDVEKAAIGKLALRGRENLKSGQPRNPVIVLTATEMFSDWHVQNTWEKVGGKHKEFASRGYLGFDNLWDFADLTQQLYLGLPDKWSTVQTTTTAKVE